MRAGRSAEAIRFYALLAFFGVLAVAGGSSRTDALSLILLRPVVVVTIAAFLLVPSSLDFGRVRPLLILLGLFAVTMTIQLVPLPPAVWLALPGHAGYGEAAAAAGLAQPWRPISLTPDLTLNSLVALLPALAVVLGFAGIGARHRSLLLLVPVAVAVASACVGLVQIVGGPDSAAYLYRPTSDLLPVGLFANRNHQAVVLAVAIPILAVWVRSQDILPQVRQFRLPLALAIGMLLLPVILVTGSRAGMVLAALGLIAAAVLAWPKPTGRGKALPRLAAVAVVLLPLALIAITVVAGRANSVSRLIGAEAEQGERRVASLPVTVDITRDFFPFGTGYGAFDPVFRQYEPDALLQPTYFNRAHNDVLETVLAGGLPAAILLLLFLIWWARQGLSAFRAPRLDRTGRVRQQLGFVVTAMMMVASCFDYPLRSPLASGLFALACCWLASASRADEPGRA